MNEELTGEDLTRHELAVTRIRIQDLEKNLDDVERRKDEFNPRVYKTLTLQYSENLAHLKILEGDYLEDLGE